MAYKFQLGKAKLSGSIETAQGITSQGGLLVNGDVDLDAGVINTAELADLSVTVGKLAADAVETAKIKDLAVTRAKLEADAVDGSKLADDAVDSEHIAAGAIDTEHIADAQVTNAKLAGSIMSSKFDGISFTGSARSTVSAANSVASDSGSLAYDSSTGVFTFAPAAPSWAKGLFSAGAGLDYDSATGAFSVGTGEVTNAMLQNSTISGKALGTNLSNLGPAANGGIASFTYNGSSAVSIALSSSVAGSGLSYSLGVVNLNVDSSTVEVDAATDNLRVKDLGITNAKLAGSIENAKLVNSSVTVAGTAGEIDVTDGALSLGGTVTLGLADTITGNRTFSGNVTINNLNVTGTMTTINTTNLEVKDARILVASGSTVFASDVGFDFGSHAGHGTLLTAEVDIDGVGGADQVLSSSLPLVAPSMKASTFYGNFVGASILGIVTEGGASATISANVTRANAASQVLTLPSAPSVGQEHRIKCVVADASSPVITIQPASGGKLEGVVDAQITLESFGAAVSLVYGGSSEGWMVF